MGDVSLLTLKNHQAADKTPHRFEVSMWFNTTFGWWGGDLTKRFPD
jgi:hypothetical protein